MTLIEVLIDCGDHRDPGGDFYPALLEHHREEHGRRRRGRPAQYDDGGGSLLFDYSTYTALSNLAITPPRSVSSEERGALAATPDGQAPKLHRHLRGHLGGGSSTEGKISSSSRSLFSADRSRPRDRRLSRGFTLLELLIVVVFVGVLAALAVPRFSTSKMKGLDATAKNDLRNAMSAQEAYFADRSTYTTAANFKVTTSKGVVLGGSGSARGYSMSARHTSSSKTFSVVIGGATSTQGKIR